MKVTANIELGSLSAFESSFMQNMEALRPAAHAAMGQRFHEIVLGNFGIAGVDRPMSWAPLSPAYAKKVGREIATLFVSGRLKDSIMVGGANADSITVSVSNSSVPYATVHQNGGKNMPARPYFPIDENGQVMPWTESQIVEAAALAISRGTR